jgi:hypothetical protein
MATQSCAKDQFYCIIYYITLNSHCEAKSVLKNDVEDRVSSQNQCMGDMHVFFFYFLRRKVKQIPMEQLFALDYTAMV